MSVAGFDVGDQACCIAVARKRGIDVLLNKESKRETPAVLSFGQKNRLLGTDAVGSIAVNPKNAVSQIKRLLGKRFSSPTVQDDLRNLLFEVVQGPDDRSVLQNQASASAYAQSSESRDICKPSRVLHILTNNFSLQL